MRKQYLNQIVSIGVLFTGLVIASSQVYAQDTIQLKQQVQALQNRVNQLELQLGNKQQGITLTDMPIYDQWEDPFAQLILMRDQIDRNMRQAFVDTGIINPRMNMKKTGSQYIITMDIPGMDKDKINVQIKDGALIISGDRHSETEDNKNNQYYRQERSFRSFMQAIPMPEDAKTDSIKAKYNNGVLTVEILRNKTFHPIAGAKKIKIS